MNKLFELEPLDFDDSQHIPARCHTRRAQTIRHRISSEKKLLEILPTELQPGYSYHCISGGDIDSLSYIKHIINQQTLDYLLFSTWCLAVDDIEQMNIWLQTGKIARIDAYVGEIFPNSYKKEYLALCQMVSAYNGRVCTFRNHAKIFAGVGPKFAFAIESSANINTNPRAENTVITICPEIYAFYKDFFDHIKSFNRNFDHWQPL